MTDQLTRIKAYFDRDPTDDEQRLEQLAADAWDNASGNQDKGFYERYILPAAEDFERLDDVVFAIYCSDSESMELTDDRMTVGEKRALVVLQSILLASYIDNIKEIAGIPGDDQELKH